VLYPRCSLVWNGGFDCSGVHCGGDSGFDQTPPESVCQQRFSGDLTFPEMVAPDLRAFERVKAVLNGGGLMEDETLKGSRSIPRAWASRLFAALGF
jgi:hypothetical protein